MRINAFLYHYTIITSANVLYFIVNTLILFHSITDFQLITIYNSTCILIRIDLDIKFIDLHINIFTYV